MKKGRVGWVVVPAILLPAVLLAVLIARYAVNFPAWDDWELVPMLEKLHSGRLRFADFWTQHNEHRLVVPKALMLVLAESSKWDLRYELVASFVVAALICLFVVWGLRRTVGPLSTGAFVVLAGAVGWIVFSTSQWDNWLWGWQVQWYLNALGMVLVAWALAGEGVLRRPGARVAIATGGALLGTLSLASGVLIWLAALPALLARRELRRYVPLWCLAGAATTALYLVGYTKPSYHPPLSAFFEHPWSSAEYILEYIGLPAAPSARSAMIPGAVVLAVSLAGVAYLARRGDDRVRVAAAPWVSLALYGVLTSGMTALGRVGFLGNPPAARYATISMLVLIGGLAVVALVLIALRGMRAGTTIVRLATVPLAGLLVFGYVLNYGRGLEHMGVRHETFLRMRGCVSGAASQSDPCLLETYPDASKLWPRVELLRRWGWGGMPEPAAPAVVRGPDVEGHGK